MTTALIFAGLTVAAHAQTVEADAQPSVTLRKLADLREHRNALARRKRCAILPFSNISAKPHAQEGFTTLTAQQFTGAGYQILSAEKVAALVGQAPESWDSQTLGEIARALDVETLVVGRVLTAEGYTKFNAARLLWLAGGWSRYSNYEVEMGVYRLSQDSLVWRDTNRHDKVEHFGGAFKIKDTKDMQSVARTQVVENLAGKYLAQIKTEGFVHGIGLD